MNLEGKMPFGIFLALYRCEEIRSFLERGLRNDRPLFAANLQYIKSIRG